MNRYPVKSFAGESLEACSVTSYGLYGDRSFAFIDESKEGWDRYVTARQIPAMLGYKAKLTGESAQLHVTSPDGRVWGWEEGLRDELQPHARVRLSMLHYDPDRTSIPENDGQMAVDSGSILIVTDRSLRQLEQMWGQRVDPRRFRANFVVTLTDDADGEQEWIGRRLAIGEAELSVDMPCERCSMITIEPDSLKRDPGILRTVNEKMELNFGVYASVVKTGQVRLGDPVYRFG
ncbi:MOSC domain-containing protein [Paenibacillus ginsengarvi]|uniref:MOSC domain-containing protein n=2 Tax=Paenibacillus ginsengarvi TaxID=400777 RepID=A0A3B0CEB9_9BACL|nr:MOSC domain-containing protein [Paenibacillus ginsengarvi]